MKSIHTVFFDIDDTLIDHTGAELKALLAIKEKYFPNISGEKFQTIWVEKSKINWQLFVDKKLSFSEQRNQRIIDVWQSCNEKVDPQKAAIIFAEYLAFYEEYWMVFPDVLSTLEELKSKSIVLGIITNGNVEQQIKKLTQTNILNFFDTKLTIISEGVGVAKPSPEIFNLAQQKANRKPEELLFIGDNYKTDIAPALTLRWNALLIDRSSGDSNKTTVRTLKEVVSYI